MDNDVVTLISKDGKSQIDCYKFMEECFMRQGYVSSKNIYVNLLYIFHNNKIIRKARVLLSLFLRCNFFFKDPESSEIVIFDSNNTRSIENILSNENFIIIATRIDEVNKIYISKKIISYMMKNFFKRSLKKNYLIVLIKIIAPKIVVTHIANSEDFHIVSKELHNEIKFIAIQTYTGSAFQEYSDDFKKNFFLPKLFCYSEGDELFYKKKKINIKSFEIVGSVKSSLSYEYVNKKKIKINPNEYDICLISEYFDIINTDHTDVKNLSDCIGLVADFTHKLCKKHNLNLIFAGNTPEGTGQLEQNGREREKQFYKHYIKDNDFKIFHKSSRKESKELSSYINVMQSKLTIALFSTLLREAISFEKRILSFNTTGHPEVAFPIPDIEFPQESICILEKPSYELFEERVLKILSMTNKEYFDQLGKEKSIIMAPTVDTVNIIRKKLKNVLEQNINSNIK